MARLKVAVDLDDTIFSFYFAYKEKYGEPKSDQEISKNVYNLRKDKDFWSNLPLIEAPDFEPEIYATKRISSKSYTRNCLKKYGLPIKPIYQTVCQISNKASIIKGRCDVLIDDSIFNVLSCIKAGVPALLIDRPHNQNVQFQFRVYSLKYEEIERVYGLFIEQWKLNQNLYLILCGLQIQTIKNILDQYILIMYPILE